MQQKNSRSRWSGSAVAAALTFGAAGLMLGAGIGGAQAQDKVRVAWGDVIDVESLPMAVALARARDRGIDNEITSFAQEDLAIQATVGGQMDIGIATPFAVMQKVKDLRIFFQDEALIFYAVVSNEYETWKDLDGQPFVFHARGSGTEAYGNFMAKQNGIQFGQISYLSGSDNRAVAMLGGQIKATILDLSNTNLVMQKAPDKFHLLPGPKQAVTNEGLFAHQDWMKSHPEAVSVITEEFLKLYREMKDNPGIIAEEREKRGLLADQPKETAETITAFIKQGMESGLWNPDGGSEALAQADLDFYSIAGALQGPADQLKVEDFWDLAPLAAAKKKLGG